MISKRRRMRRSQEKQEKIIQKQINYDFQTYQYLNQNQLLKNSIEEYSKLFNSMIATKNQKKNKFSTLIAKFTLLKYKTFKESVSKKSINEEQSYSFKNQFLKSQEKVSVQTEIKNQLDQEITQIKKSLNLLKGDIGHLVNRNQSTKLIQSKASKVKIVADDQLQRVSMAFSKDKDELKTRADMQKRFKKNLKNVSIFENSALKKFRNNYVEMMMKKKQINNRLSRIQKTSSLINRSIDAEKIKDQKNLNTKQLYQCLLKLFNLIQQINKNKDKFKIPEIEKKITLEEINTEKLCKFQKIIISQSTRVNKQIQRKAISYNLQMKRHQQLILKLQSLNQLIEKQFQRYCYQAELKFIVSQDIRRQNKIKLKKFCKNLRILFIFLQFVEKFISNSQKQQNIKPKTIQNTSQFFNQKSYFPSQVKSSFQYLNQKNASSSELKNKKKSKIQSSFSKNYISNLLGIYKALQQENSQEQLEKINTDIFQELQSDACKWFFIIKQKYEKKNLLTVPSPRKQQKLQNFPKPRRSTSRLRQSRASIFVLPKTSKQLEDDEKIQIIEEDKFHSQMHKLFQLRKRQKSVKQPHSLNSFHVWQQKNKSKSKQQLKKSSKNIISSSSLINEQKLKHNSQYLDCNKALRVNLLQKVDKDYYKMLKSTLKMEKQNTKKNYVFTRNFKRQKYSPHNQILEQRRFQCTFSIAFAKNSSQALKRTFNQNKKNKFIRQSNLQKRISKLNQTNFSFYDLKPKITSDERSSFSSQQSSRLFPQKKKEFLKGSKSVILKSKFNQEFKEIINLI